LTKVPPLRLRRPHASLVALAALASGCGGSSGSLSSGSSSGSGAFAWDGGGQSAACAVQDCLVYVTSMCPPETQAMCAGSSSRITSNAIVTDVCFKDGSHQTLTQYASSLDAIAYRADGTQCLHELSDTSGTVTIEDSSGHVVGTMDFHSLDNFTCGGNHSTSLSCADAGQIHLVSLEACQATPGPCP
jgi:hypothetical protein